MFVRDMRCCSVVTVIVDVFVVCLHVVFWSSGFYHLQFKGSLRGWHRRVRTRSHNNFKIALQQLILDKTKKRLWASAVWLKRWLGWCGDPTPASGSLNQCLFRWKIMDPRYHFLHGWSFTKMYHWPHRMVEQVHFVVHEAIIEELYMEQTNSTNFAINFEVME